MGISTHMHARTCSLATPHTGSTVHSQLLRSTWALPARPCALAASQTRKLTACRVAALWPNLAGVPHRRLAVSQPRGLPRSLAALRPRGIPRSLAASRHPSQPRGLAASLAASRLRSLAASQPCGLEPCHFAASRPRGVSASPSRFGVAIPADTGCRYGCHVPMAVLDRSRVLQCRETLGDTLRAGLRVS